MKRILTTLIILATAITSWCADFDKFFTDNTLRLDVKVARDSNACVVTIDSIAQWPGWYGRRVNLDKELYPEAMRVSVIDRATNDTIYVDSKSPNVLAEDDRDEPCYIQVLVPKPLADCEIVATVFGYEEMPRGKAHTASVTLTTPILRALNNSETHTPLPHLTLRKALDPEHSLNLAIVAEGYTSCEADSFYTKAAELDSVLFSQPTFKEYADRFNVVAVMVPSDESGITIPSQEVKINSALGAHFDSFGTERLMTLYGTNALWDALEGIPASQVLILANTPKYGGSGAYNEYAIASANLPSFAEILIHEFGHSFAWLGDEYEFGYYEQYTSDFEPMEPNITTLHDFTGKWQNLIDSGEASLIEGGGYQSKGVWRGCEHCLMRAIEDQKFCPVCAQALKKTIEYYTQQN